MELRPSHALSVIAAVVLCAHGAQAAKLVTLVIDTVPSGARVEQKGATLGTTPLQREYPKTYFTGPRTLFSKRLGEAAVITLYKDGYYPKTVELTHGPFLWRSLNGQNAFVYYTLDTSYTIHLEPLPGTTTPDRPRATLSHGTAFHCHHDGYLVTNYHVVEGNERVSLSRGNRRCTAAVAGSDKANDLAILQVDSDCLQTLGLGSPLPLGSSATVLQGQEVVTYGFPLPSEFGGEPQVSTGIVKSTSGLDADPRTLTISNSIQPGNSGGPLLGSDGSVVGVVTATLNAGYLYPKYEALPQDLNFAIKSEYVRLLFQLIGITENSPVAAPIASPTSAPPTDTTLPGVGLPDLISRVQSNVVLVTAPPPKEE